MFRIVLIIFGLSVLYRFLVMCFWIVAWLAAQPVRLELHLLGAICAPARWIFEAEALPPP
jgi:hypothetical protein